ncbi:MAG: archaeal heat shock protein Hsp20 [Chloroflexota bacterium]
MEGREVRELRTRLRLSQERFAHLLGVSVQTVRRWEVGLTRPLPLISVRLEELSQKLGEGEKKGGDEMVEKSNKGTPEAVVEVGLGGIFKGMGNLFDVISQMAKEGSGEYSRSGNLPISGDRVKGVYGFSVRMGLGGKPIIGQFGNIKETKAGPVVSETREPLVDVMDEGRSVVVVAELPGVEEKDIHLAVNGDVLEMSASSKDRKYYREVLLPAAVDASSMKTSFVNGVLEIRLSKLPSFGV